MARRRDPGPLIGRCSSYTWRLDESHHISISHFQEWRICIFIIVNFLELDKWWVESKRHWIFTCFGSRILVYSEQLRLKLVCWGGDVWKVKVYPPTTFSFFFFLFFFLSETKYRSVQIFHREIEKVFFLIIKKKRMKLGMFPMHERRPIYKLDIYFRIYEMVGHGFTCTL
jgi:hypothetical protein